MDYWAILKRAWQITWRYKALWVLGLFAGASGGTFGGAGGRSGTGYRTGREDLSRLSSQVTGWVEAHLPLVIAAGALLALLALVFWVLSIAAQAGLVYGANEAAEGRRPSLGSCWRAGFKRWGRVFMIGVLVGLPVVVVALVVGAIVAAVVAGGLLAPAAERTVALLVGACLGLPLVVALIVVLAVALGIVYQLALRYGVLADATFGQALVAAWNDLFSRRGAVVFWLVMLLPGFAYAAVAGALVVPFAVIAVLLFMRDLVVAAAAVLVGAGLALVVPSAVYSTFASSAWTLFFRTLRGMDVATSAASAGAGGAPGATHVSPGPASWAAPGADTPTATNAPSGWAPPTGAPIVDVQPPPSGAADE